MATVSGDVGSQAYYDDQDQWGNYQYITLEDVINNYLMSRDPDDYTSMTPRYRILYQARRGLREFYYDVLREIRAVKLELSTSLMVTLPPDYVNYVRISWIDDNGLLHPMAKNEAISMAVGYLQDHEYNLLFDATGCVLQDNSSPTVQTESVLTTDTSTSSGSLNTYEFCNKGFEPNRNMSNHYPNGSYNIDKNRGVIFFDSTAFGREIVLEYISDGLWTGCEGRDEDELRVHKFAEMALIEFIYHELIKRRRNVPYNEKMRARKDFYNLKRIAKRRISTLRKDELLQAFKGSSKWIKGN
jgi:hypothetical protein